MKLQVFFDRFFREEKDIFILVLGIFLIMVFFFHIVILPFRFDSLVIFFLYLIVTRPLIDDFTYQSYVFVSLIGLILTTILSPYTLTLFFFIAILLYKKTRII